MFANREAEQIERSAENFIQAAQKHALAEADKISEALAAQCAEWKRNIANGLNEVELENIKEKVVQYIANKQIAKLDKIFQLIKKKCAKKGDDVVTMENGKPYTIAHKDIMEHINHSEEEHKARNITQLLTDIQLAVQQKLDGQCVSQANKSNFIKNLY